MPRYLIGQYQLYRIEYEVEADSLAAAIAKVVVDGEFDTEGDKRWLGECWNEGMPLDYLDPLLLDELEKLDFPMSEDNILPTVASFHELPPAASQKSIEHTSAELPVFDLEEHGLDDDGTPLRDGTQGGGSLTVRE